MQLPIPLRRAIEQELASADPARLRAAAARLSEFYRQDFGAQKGATLGAIPLGAIKDRAFAGSALASDDLRAAYLAVRLPATFAAVVAALGWTREVFADEIRSVLDLGSGPGTALWAAMQAFPAIDSATAIERDPRLIEIARRLAAGAESPALRQANWLEGELTADLPEGTWDLVVCSYTLNELGQAQRAALLRKAWARTGKLLVVVEPGTVAGFANVLAARTQMLALNAALNETQGAALDANRGVTLAAPCPNSLDCPMAKGGDWCHFAARVERTAEHRRLKDATLGHEDEKFSYVAFARGVSTHTPPSGEPGDSDPAGETVQARIVRHPRIFSGYTQLTLCRAGEIANTTVTRSKKEDWRRLKRLGWGDRW
jgi:ribosomal protein RSM22 (predicted rRNA methylase)